MAIYRPICRAGKPDDAAHLHREMPKSIAHHAAGGLAGALAVLSTNFTCAATLNENLRIAESPPLGIVASGSADSAGRHRSVEGQFDQAGRPQAGRKSPEPPKTAAEIVGSMLAPGASNPDVPLPHPDLSERVFGRTDAPGPLTGPTPYGRVEPGGGVLGFRIPIPVDRGAKAVNTISSPAALGLEASPEGVLNPDKPHCGVGVTGRRRVNGRRCGWLHRTSGGVYIPCSW